MGGLKMTVRQNDYKNRLFLLRGVISRQEVAKKMGLTYNTLSSRLVGMTPWRPGEEVQINKILTEAERSVEHSGVLG
jgi:hypothetical protein